MSYTPTEQDTVNYRAWIAVVNAAYSAGPMPYAPGFLPGASPPPAPPAYDVPDANGLVALSGITNPHVQGFRFAVDEVAKNLSGAQKGIAEANINYVANAKAMFGLPMGPCVECHAQTDPTTGSTTYTPNYGSEYKIIPNTFAMPSKTLNGYDLSTVAGVVAMWNASTANFGQGVAPGTGFEPGH